MAIKRVLLALTASLLALSLLGCGIKKKIEEKAAEKIIESMGGGKVDVQGDKVTIKGQDGQSYTAGETQWPTSDLAKSIPEFKAGKINGVFDSKESVMISMEEVPEKEYKSYADTIKKQFDQDTYSAENEDALSYGGSDGNGVTVSLYYGVKERVLTISLAKAAN